MEEECLFPGGLEVEVGHMHHRMKGVPSGDHSAKGGG